MCFGEQRNPPPNRLPSTPPSAPHALSGVLTLLPPCFSTAALLFMELRAGAASAVSPPARRPGHAMPPHLGAQRLPPRLGP